MNTNPVLGVIGGAIGLASQIAHIVGTEIAMKFANELADQQKQLLDELSKDPSDQDDAKVVYLYKSIQISQEGLANELAIYKSGAVAQAPSSPAQPSNSASA